MPRSRQMSSTIRNIKTVNRNRPRGNRDDRIAEKDFKQLLSYTELL